MRAKSIAKSGSTLSEGEKGRAGSMVWKKTAENISKSAVKIRN
jgi:hypothetical protein